MMRFTGRIRREPVEQLDFATIRRDHPLADVVAAVVPLKQSGRGWKARCPFHQERTPSFTIYDGGHRFHCFGCGAQGDVFDFLQRLLGIGLVDAAKLLTGGDLPGVPVTPAARSVSAGAVGDRDRSDEARAIWRAAVPAAGTVAERYLCRRGIEILPPTIRYGELPLGRRAAMPCLIALVTDVGDRPTGIQRCFLSPDGTKADLPGGKVKFSLGKIAGGAVRLASAAKQLVICEGLEDALSIQQQLDQPTWASCGTSNLPMVQLPLEVLSVVVAADNDEAGDSAGRKAARAFAEQGRSVRIIHPLPGFKDWNDELRGAD